MNPDLYRFLDPWTLLLPEGGGAVLVVTGSGGRSTLLERLARHYVGRGRTVLRTQTVAHPAPPTARVHAPAESGAIADSLGERGQAFVATPTGAASEGGVSAESIERLRGELRPDIVLVDAHARCERPLRRDGVAPSWPVRADLAFGVASLAVVGRPWSAKSVAGAPDEAPRLDDGSPRRVGTADVLEGLLDGEAGPFAGMPERCVPIPFLSGFGSYRDMDGMFALVSALWERPGVRAVCLAEMLGDERRDAADLGGLPAGPEGQAPLAGERVYAVYPASLDES